MRKSKDYLVELIFFGLIGVLLLQFVFSLAPVWNGADINYSINEDTNYYHNLSANITGYSGDITFSIDTDSNINWTNASGTYSVTASQVSRWMRIQDSSIGNFTINATFDNQTGFFVVPMQATNNTGGDFSGAVFEFMVNATNDAPAFENINNTYNMSAASALYEYLNASDEERHYPLIFNITFLSNCSLASWSTRTNCTLFNFTETQNTSAIMNFTPTNNDVGVYWANITVMDAANVTGCPHDFCDNATYAVNKTTAHSQLVVFNTFASLEVNTTNCTDKIFQANSTDWCLINITTKGYIDELNITTYAILRNYAAGQSNVVNTSWFYGDNITSSDSFYKTINVTVTPWKTEIGNWTINFTVIDNTHNENITSEINVWVNKTYDDTPDLASISNVQSSINLVNLINLSVYDDDLLIPDKQGSLGGFNETTNFTTVFLNQSDLTQELSISDYNISILYMPVAGSNITTAQIYINASSSEIGNYTLNITVNDSQGLIDYEFFNFSVINNTAPQWNASITTLYEIYEDNNTWINFSLNVSDADAGDTLTYTYVYDVELPSFDVNSTTGLVNFTPRDSDVGQHIINITVSDGYLTDTESFNFTIFNINDEFIIKNLDGTNVTPASGIWNGSVVNATEDNYSVLTLWVEDDDFKIPSSQRAVFYNESLNVSVNITGLNTSLLNFVKDTSWPSVLFPNKSKYEAVFTPRKGDIGDYEIIINVTDNSSFSNYITFNISIGEIEHAPVMDTLTNQTSAVNRSLYYNINVTDLEQGNDTTSVINENFTFSYEFLADGTTPGFLNTSVFNDTLGIINITFNNTQKGNYHINMTVNDTTGRETFDDFWVAVYGPPNVSVPSSTHVFNLVENSSYVLNFSANHSVGDNLTYDFYIDAITYNGTDYVWSSLLLRNNVSSFGNGSNYSWSFTPNFTDETYSKYKNLTLVVYPENSDLANASTLNTTQNWALNVTHTNYPISFDGNIDSQGPVSYENDITIDLTPYFYDPDNADQAIAETVTFTLTGNTSLITGTVDSDWVLTLSASQAVTGRMNLTGFDTNSNATSNNFVVQFVAPTTSTTSESTSSGGSRTIKEPVSLKILMPDPVSAYKNDRIELPITLYNDGSTTLYNIDLSGTIAINETIPDDVVVNLSITHFDVLAVGEKKNLTMVIEVNTEKEGLYEITVFADVTSPDYHDWGKMYLTVKEGENIEEKILFTEEFIAENPECLELQELVEEAKILMNAGQNEAALLKAEEALNACKLAIEQAAIPRITQIMENKLYRYILIATLTVFFAGLGYYSYKRMKLRRRRGLAIQQDIKNIKFLEK